MGASIVFDSGVFKTDQTEIALENCDLSPVHNLVKLFSVKLPH